MLAVVKNRRRRVNPSRNAECTRQRLLEAAFQEVHRSGFRSADIDRILTTAGVTKGALYYYFDGKEALGHAVVDEVIATMTRDKWLRPLQNAENAIDVLIGVVRSISLKPEDIQCGCPLNNLAQEMSPLDEGFRKRLAKIFCAWQAGIAAALRGGQRRRVVRPEIDTNETAAFLVATVEGYFCIAKNSQEVAVLRSGVKRIIGYLESLRPQTGEARRKVRSGMKKQTVSRPRRSNVH
jgi:TetR/AcrR family transcriptional regulator, transcriptional repressor for nem operon